MESARDTNDNANNANGNTASADSEVETDFHKTHVSDKVPIEKQSATSETGHQDKQLNSSDLHTQRAVSSGTNDAQNANQCGEKTTSTQKDSSNIDAEDSDSTNIVESLSSETQRSAQSTPVQSEQNATKKKSRFCTLL